MTTTRATARRGAAHRAATLALAFVAAAGASAVGANPVLEGKLRDLRGAGAETGSAQRGETLWSRPEATDDGSTRRCATCHTRDLRALGKHAKTGKTIDALAPSANASRLSDRAEIDKWLRRNCRWTWGRLCSPQEQADLLSYIASQ